MKILKCALCGGEPWRNYDRPVETSLYCCDKRVRTGRCATERDAEKKWNEIQRALIKAQRDGQEP